MTAPIETTGSVAEAPPEAVLAGASAKQIEGRSLGRIAWERLKRDKVALGGGIVVVLLLLVGALAPVLCALVGQEPDIFHTDLLDASLGIGTPKGAFGGMSSTHLLGIDPTYGRDIFSRIVYGAQISLIVAFGAAALAVVIGVLLGMAAGFLGGWVDSFISRTMDVLLAFPQLLFSIALVSVVPTKLFGLSGSGPRILVLIFVIGFFGWPYIGRIVRGQTLSLREREFVEAARSLGAGRVHILLKELLPNLVAPILVYTTLMIPTNILNEAALSFLGVGVQPPTPSWGQMLSDSVQYYTVDPAYMVIPGLAIFITVLSFNLFGDGLRDALDPKGN
ncbi:ABC transporter permease [Streptacidiphilus sp. ASG 303]|uniref:ABC transporter permease n=1 Tax=Streptacidiphilus sp. ASG 303 TaxID=2896847 RepID=UPI001E326224|nr:ABC transporter permease [Streptacidiphilus sp. ASG 303]MCD0483035.1 ABC transporter permease [Streptacidiphilus sp. ASG 303]